MELKEPPEDTFFILLIGDSPYSELDDRGDAVGLPGAIVLKEHMELERECL